jgi:hypothetical protein
MELTSLLAETIFTSTNEKKKQNLRRTLTWDEKRQRHLERKKN